MTRRVPVTLLALAVAGCAGADSMLRVDHPFPAAADKATIVFLRPSHQGKIDTPLYDVTDGRLEFLGVLARATKMACLVTPGAHVFMVYDDRHHGKRAGFLNAEVSAGKTYYVLLKPRFGDLFGLLPLRPYDFSRPEFAQWLTEPQMLETGPEAAAAWEQQRDQVTATRDEYWPDFQRTLEPADHLLNTVDGRDPAQPLPKPGEAAQRAPVAAAAPPAPSPPPPPAVASAPAAPPAGPSPAAPAMPSAAQAPPPAPPAAPPAVSAAVSPAVSPAVSWSPVAGSAAKLKAGAAVHARPTADPGAPPKVPQAKVLLKSTISNPAGTWWFVTVPGDSGWVLEKDLEAPGP